MPAYQAPSHHENACSHVSPGRARACGVGRSFMASGNRVYATVEMANTATAVKAMAARAQPQVAPIAPVVGTGSRRRAARGRDVDGGGWAGAGERRCVRHGARNYEPVHVPLRALVWSASCIIRGTRFRQGRAPPGVFDAGAKRLVSLVVRVAVHVHVVVRDLGGEVSGELAARGTVGACAPADRQRRRLRAYARGLARHPAGSPRRHRHEHVGARHRRPAYPKVAHLLERPSAAWASGSTWPRSARTRRCCRASEVPTLFAGAGPAVRDVVRLPAAGGGGTGRSRRRAP